MERIAFTGGSPYRKPTRSWRFTNRTIGCSDPRVSIDLGFRFEHQAISQSLRVAPRGGINWNLFPRFGTVVRAGVGSIL